MLTVFADYSDLEVTLHITTLTSCTSLVFVKTYICFTETVNTWLCKDSAAFLLTIFYLMVICELPKANHSHRV